MKTILLTVLLVLAGHISFSQNEGIPTDEEILKLYDGLRVSDVIDGMDVVGLWDKGLMDTKIESLWKDLENFKHRICGIAVTVRYTPTNRIVKNPMSPEEFDKWSGEWYTNLSPEPFVEYLKSGSIIVMDQQGNVDCGTAGSFNTLFWVSKGARGLVSNGGVRDIDELIKEKVPVYLDLEKRGRGIRPGRNEIESVNKPITVGGVLVRPGDIVVADSDGVIVVPREYAVPVATLARKILEGDKRGRLELYKKLGLTPDKTVE